MLRFFTTAVLAASTIAAAAPSLAQDANWPTRAVTIVGGFPNGAGTDLYARKLGQSLGEVFGVSFVADNRTGAGGNIASDLVARAPADGYTFLLGTAGTHAINAALYKDLLAATGEAPKWNFHKYLIARDGRTVTSFGTRTAPDDKALVAAIEAALAVPMPRTHGAR